MNELIYNFINQIEDVNKIKEMSIEEFSKLVKSNELISENDAKQLIESFKNISNKKDSNDDTTDSEQRKKKYKQEANKDINTEMMKKEQINRSIIEKENDENSMER